MQVFVFDEVGSTQDEARSRFGGDPVLVVAARQSAGRGREGRVWDTASRAVAASVAVTPVWPERAWPRIALIAGLAARHALGEGVGLKWPNDLVTVEGKVGGILVEGADRTVVAGLGINLWWPRPPEGAAALHEADPGPGRAAELARAWADELLRRLAAPFEMWGREEYRSACSTLGRRVRWQPGGEGSAVDIDEDGALLVDTPSGRVRLGTGEVWEVRAVSGD
jgi:BirA family biotin operon repressor/biotin-[acetyl-CoA-carboxylase] ligase